MFIEIFFQSSDKVMRVYCTAIYVQGKLATKASHFFLFAQIFGVWLLLCSKSNIKVFVLEFAEVLQNIIVMPYLVIDLT